MRLGGFYEAQTLEELPQICEKMDENGLSAIRAPRNLADMSVTSAVEFGDTARALGLVVGECGYWSNLMTDDADLRAARIRTVRRMLEHAEAMRCQCIVTLAGTKDIQDRAAAPHAKNFTESFINEFREVVLQILDGLELKFTTYNIEPWPTTFFYQPEVIREFIDSVDHPNFGVHLDQMNMISYEFFYNTTDLIHKSFDLLADKVGSIHLKDLQWHPKHMMLRWDEVFIGEGVMDYETYLRRIFEDLPDDMCCFCEHLKTEEEYIRNFNTLHELAEKAGVHFHPRVV